MLVIDVAAIDVLVLRAVDASAALPRSPKGASQQTANVRCSAVIRYSGHSNTLANGLRSRLIRQANPDPGGA